MANGLSGSARHSSDLGMASPSAVCIGSGRFLRAVLVPVLQRVGCDVLVFQTRGVAFADACAAADGRYEVDTILRDGRVATETLQLQRVGSLAREQDRRTFLELPSRLPTLRYVGLGVTDAGFARDSAVMRDLAEFLVACHLEIPDNTISVINTDNVPANGDAVRACVLSAEWPERPQGDAWRAFVAYLDTRVHFHNTMVDRLTSHRPGDPLVPLAEPWPTKVLAIQDSAGVLDAARFESIPGVVVRSTRDELLRDQKLKLRIANATSSALVYVLSLSRFRANNEARTLPAVLAYRDGLFYRDLLPSLEGEGVSRELAVAVYDEWKDRSSHAHFGLVNLWVTQNAWMHFQARLFPTLRANVARDAAYRAGAFMVFATASILRFLTPLRTSTKTIAGRPVYIGFMDERANEAPVYDEELEGDWIYGGELHANLVSGEYEFLQAPQTEIASLLGEAAAAVRLNRNEKKTPTRVHEIVSEVLASVPELVLTQPAFKVFVSDVAEMYSRLVANEKDGRQSALSVLRSVVGSEPRV